MITASSDGTSVWDILATALIGRHAVRARYRGAERILCPHILGWKNGRPKALCYQAGGTTSHGPLPAETRERWRSLFIDEIETAVIVDQPWATAENYSHNSNCVDQIELAHEALN